MTPHEFIEYVTKCDKILKQHSKLSWYTPAMARADIIYTFSVPNPTTPAEIVEEMDKLDE